MLAKPYNCVLWQMTTKRSQSFANPTIDRKYISNKASLIWKISTFLFGKITINRNADFSFSPAGSKRIQVVLPFPSPTWTVPDT